MAQTSDLLLEIGLEEMPAAYVSDASEQFRRKVSDWLTAQKISHGIVDAYATPRRLAVLAHDVAHMQEDQEETSRGPAKQIAIDDNGDWTKAALGFAKGQGVAADDLVIKDVKDKTYVLHISILKGSQQLTYYRNCQRLSNI